MHRMLIATGLAFLIAAPLAAAPPAFAQEAGPPADQARAVVQKLGEETVAAFAAADTDQRRKLLAAAAQPAIDFAAIGRSVLNYAGLRVPSNREGEIMDGMAAYVKRVMATELERVRPDKAEIGAVAMKGDNEARVVLTLAGPQDKLAGEWQVKKGGDGWRVTDIFASGSSLSQHLGGKLARYGGVDQLHDFLRNERERLKQMAQRPM